MLGYFIQYTFLWVEFVGALKFVMGPLSGAEFGPVTVYFFFLSGSHRPIVVIVYSGSDISEKTEGIQTKLTAKQSLPEKKIIARVAGQIVLESVPTLVNSYPFLVNSYLLFGQLLSLKSTRTYFGQLVPSLVNWTLQV